MTELKNNFLESLNSGINSIYEHFNSKIETLQQEININCSTIKELEKYDYLEDKYNLLQMEFEEYKKVSMVKNLVTSFMKKIKKLSF